MLHPIDRIAGRIAQEVRAARRARHPRARIAHFMIADAYRSLMRRALRDRSTLSGDEEAAAAEPSIRAEPGFLTDRNA